MQQSAAVPRRRIAVLINDMNASGGIQRVAANLVRDLGSRYEMVLLSVEPLRNPVFHEPGLVFESLGYERNYGSSRTQRLIEYARVGRLLRRWTAQHRVDGVLAFWYDWASVSAWALPRNILKIGCEHISYDEASPRMRKLRALSYPRLDCAVSLTAADLPSLAAVAPRAVVIPNYVPEADCTSFEQREKILLSVGHLDSRKGFDRLLWGLKPALHRHPDWKLMVVGGGEKGHIDWGYMDYVATLLNVLELNGRVEFHPATRRIDQWYRRASVYVMGSRREGLPMVLLEAKSFGLPSIAFNCPTGPKEIIQDGADGFVIENDSDAFAEAASTLMRDDALRQRMGEAALSDARTRFSADVVLDQWTDLIESLSGAHGRAQVRAVPPLSGAGALRREPERA